MAYKNTYEDLLQDIQASGQNWSSYDMELAKANPDAGRSIYSQKQAWANAQTDAERKAANDAAEMIRKQYGGYTGGKDGGSFTLNGQYSASNTAREVRRLLMEKHLARGAGTSAGMPLCPGSVRFLTTDDVPRFTRLGELFLNMSIAPCTVEQVEL